MATMMTLSAELSIVAACSALGLARATFYRRRRPFHGPARKRVSPRALAEHEKTTVLATLHEQRFVDLAPAEVYATMLDEGRYLCSERTMYRVLAQSHEARERRAQLRHPTTWPEFSTARCARRGATGASCRPLGLKTTSRCSSSRPFRRGYHWRCQCRVTVASG